MLTSPLKQKAQTSSCGVRRAPSSIGRESPKYGARLMRLVKPSLMATPASSAAAPQRAISLHGRFDPTCSKLNDPGRDTAMHEFNAWTKWSEHRRRQTMSDTISTPHKKQQALKRSEQPKPGHACAVQSQAVAGTAQPRATSRPPKQKENKASPAREHAFLL